MTGNEKSLPVFVYGTLMTSGRAHRLVAPAVVRVERASVCGRRADTGAGYLGVRFGEGEEIFGELLFIEPSRLAEVLAVLDEYEGVPGLYTRVVVAARTAAGHEVQAYAYDFAGLPW